MTIFVEILIAVILLVIHYGSKTNKHKHMSNPGDVSDRLYEQHDSSRINSMDEIQARRSINSEELKTILANRQTIQSDYRKMIKEQKDKKILKKYKTKVNT